MAVQFLNCIVLNPRSKMNCAVLVSCTILLCLSFPLSLAAQSRQFFTLFGDVKVDESELDERVSSRVDVFLYKAGSLVGRQTIDVNGRYRFMNLSAGMYEIAIEIENVEVVRLSKLIAGQVADDVRMDINLAWRSNGRGNNRAGVISAADSYPREGRNKTLYQKSARQIEEKRFDEAIATLREVVDVDPADYPAWFQLGFVYFIRQEYGSAEQCFLTSIKSQSSYLPPIFNLGRVRMAKKNYDGAIEAFEKTLKVDSRHAAANYFMGEAYLQLKKGSVAVKYFATALKLDPLGMADAHLRLASLYNQAGYKDLAAGEYEQFLQKRPDYAHRKQLEEYIATNKSKPPGPKP